MAIVFMGVYWVLMAILSWFGWWRVTKKEYRDKPWRKDFQKDMAVPDAVMGVGFLCLGLKYPDTHAQDSLFFILGLFTIAWVAIILAIRVRGKYNLW